MRIINALNTPFFLTGGTALSRHYFNHRYSDDLDLFVNDDKSYSQLIDRILTTLDDPKYRMDFRLDKANLKKLENYTQVLILHSSSPEISLKIDFINDIAPHYGNKEFHTTLGIIDSWRNILSNKITALFRFEPKDIADIWVIAKNKAFDWKTIIKEAKTKEAGVEPEIVFNIIKSFPVKELELVKWVVEPDIEIIKSDLSRIADDIFWGKENSFKQ
ncbi:MAG TPA: nucleotidyl transferase AbiEii/AbiGii toxin family protein [Candidatus Marinimicrobia bacterium]|nr:nucleotidyl transferase AbiEii/AbiGii toxin family protein [Candidatus Neomarinimicrobiota bacterium]HRU92714.1 nucleotidyl transferase AbiEii/AbiGii toxin family protein [Candidatus Neomarinimicrobiota bacterium]